MQRIVGVDTARGLAILGMFVAHLGLVRDSEVLSATGWFFIADGRSSALFALLAGVGLAFMTRQAQESGAAPEWRRQRIRIAKRAGWLYLLGWVLTLLGTPVAVILPSYALMFLLCLPFLRLPGGTLLVWAAGILLVLQIPVLATHATLDDASLLRIVPLLGELLTGYYPAIVWVAYMLIGLAVGRLPLREPAMQAMLVVAGSAAALLAYGSGWLLNRMLDPPAGSVPAMLISTEPHTDSAIEMAGNAGVAIAVIGSCLLVTRPAVLRLLVRPVSAAGAMALTVYSLQIVYIRILGSDAVWSPESNLPLIWLVVGTLLAATVWQLLFGQGPFERALHALIRTEPAPRPGPPNTPNSDYPPVPQRRR